ncbi:MAG: hypothetical protein ABMA64_07755 [Myxococcota bacterium]
MVLLALAGCAAPQWEISARTLGFPPTEPPTDGSYFRWTGATQGVLVGVCTARNPSGTEQTRTVRASASAGPEGAIKGGSARVTLGPGAERDVTFGFRLPAVADDRWVSGTCEPGAACVGLAGHPLTLRCALSEPAPELDRWETTSAVGDVVRLTAEAEGKIGVAQVARLSASDPTELEQFAKVLAQTVLPAQDVTMPGIVPLRHAFTEVAWQPLGWGALPDRSDGVRRWLATRQVPAYSTLAARLGMAGLPEERLGWATHRVGAAVLPCGDHALAVAVVELQTDLVYPRSTMIGELVDDALGWTDAQPGLARWVGCDPPDLAALAPPATPVPAR